MRIVEKENTVPSVLLIVEKEMTLFVIIHLSASTKKTVNRLRLILCCYHDCLRRTRGRECWVGGLL